MVILRPWRYVPILAVGLLLLGIILSHPFFVSAQEHPNNHIAAALANASRASGYSVRGQIHNTTHPVANLMSVGQSSRTQSVFLEGTVDKRSGDMLVSLWQETGSTGTRSASYAYKIEDGKHWVRIGASEWQEQDAASAPGASESDFLGYLRLIDDVTVSQAESDAQTPPTRYHYTISSAAYGRYLTEMLTADLRASGNLAPGIDLSALVQQIEASGDGELWLDANRVPVHQTLQMDIHGHDGAKRTTRLALDFAFTGLDDLSASGSGSTIVGSRALKTAIRWFDMNQLRAPDSHAGMAAIVAGVLGACAVMLLRKRSRAVYTAVVAAILVSMVGAPIASSIKLVEFDRYIASLQAAAPAEAETRATAVATSSLEASSGANVFHPHRDPLAGLALPPHANEAFAEARMGPPLPHAVGAQTRGAPSGQRSTAASALQQAEECEDIDDTDCDGLSNWVEYAIGTSPEHLDSDGDLISDRIEVEGSVYTGRTWYGDPNRADTNGDTIFDGLEWDLNGDGLLDDTDGDGVPDFHDDDNDGDGVPDWIDVSPNTLMGNAYGAEQGFAYRATHLQAGKSFFVNLQIVPENRNQLWYAYNVVDWPLDALAQYKDLDDATFADAGTSALDPSNAWGDTRIVPMLEIRVPQATGILPDAAILTAYGIGANSADGEAGERFIYVPLAVVTDEHSGERVALNAEIPYIANANWVSGHEARLTWVVQGLNDYQIPCVLTDPACPDQGYTTDLNNPTLIQVYYEPWRLAGMKITEESGTRVAAAYLDPAMNQAQPGDKSSLYHFSSLMDQYFLQQVDPATHSGNEWDLVNNITVDTVTARWDRATNSSQNADTLLGVPNELRVQKIERPTRDEAFATLGMTLTRSILNDHAGLWQTDNEYRPLIMYLYETQTRSLSLPNANAPDPNIDFQWSEITFDFPPREGDALPVTTVVGKKWTMFCGTGGSAQPQWSECAIADYWDETRNQYHGSAEALNDPYTDLAAGRMGYGLVYTLAMKKGVAIPIRSGSTLVAPASAPMNGEEAIFWSQTMQQTAGEGEPYAIAPIVDDFEQRTSETTAFYAASASLDIAWGGADALWWSLEVRNAWNDLQNLKDNVERSWSKMQYGAMIGMTVITGLGIGLVIATIIAEKLGAPDEVFTALDIAGTAIDGLSVGLAALSLLAAVKSATAGILDAINEAANTLTGWAWPPAWPFPSLRTGACFSSPGVSAAGTSSAPQSCANMRTPLPVSLLMYC